MENNKFTIKIALQCNNIFLLYYIVKVYIDSGQHIQKYGRGRIRIRNVKTRATLVRNGSTDPNEQTIKSHSNDDWMAS